MTKTSSQPPSCILSEGVRSLGLSISGQQQNKIQIHMDLIKRWHSKINLVAYTDEASFISRHILDSLALMPLISDSKTILDIGTGAGFPGLVLAAVLPESEFTLLDSRQRRIEFLRLVTHQATFKNVQVVASRVEDFGGNSSVQNAVKFDTLVVRAMASLSRLIELTCHLHLPGQRLIAMKGQYPQAELEELEKKHASRLESVRIETLDIPFLDAARHAVIIEF